MACSLVNIENLIRSFNSQREQFRNVVWHIFFPDTPLRTTVKVDTPQQKTEHSPAPPGYDGDKAKQQKLSKETLCRLHPQASRDGH